MSQAGRLSSFTLLDARAFDDEIIHVVVRNLVLQLEVEERERGGGARRPGVERLIARRRVASSERGEVSEEMCRALSQNRSRSRASPAIFPRKISAMRGAHRLARRARSRPAAARARRWPTPRRPNFWTSGCPGLRRSRPPPPTRPCAVWLRWSDGRRRLVPPAVAARQLPVGAPRGEPAEAGPRGRDLARPRRRIGSSAKARAAARSAGTPTAT